MIDALIHGRLIHVGEIDGEVIGRIVIENDKPIQFTARRGAVKRALLALPQGHPLAAAGTLTTRVMHDKEGVPYVRHDLRITSILTAQPSQPGGIAAFFKKATP